MFDKETQSWRSLKKDKLTSLDVNTIQERLMPLVSDLVNIVKKIDFFATDKNDEFQIMRENGESQGIFKTWAVPVIPFLETDSLQLLAGSFTKEGDELLDNQEVISELLNGWSKKYTQHPSALAQVLEKWRGFSATSDRRLHEIFTNEALPDDSQEKVVVLFHRLMIAFGLAAPFYHLEAIVADKNSVAANPFSGQEKPDLNNNKSLDLVGMLLPSALAEFVLTDSLDWKGLNWNILHQKVEEIKDLYVQEAVVLFRIARRLGVSMEDVLFAANVLQWIPVSVAGKKNDVESQQAQELIKEAVDVKPATLNHVASEANSLIRLYNWFPITESEQNFAGEGWRYAAVCDTANQLLEAVKVSGIFSQDFEELFRAIIEPQLENIDATSAKGRLLLQLLDEDAFSPEITAAVHRGKEAFIQKATRQLAEMKAKEMVQPLSQRTTRFMGGGKVAGLQEARMIFGQEKVLDGCFISTEAIEDLLRTDPGLWKMVQQLEFGIDLTSDQVGDLAQKIRTKIMQLNIPTELIIELQQELDFPDAYALRSSSFDEDNQQQNTAAGVYESKVNISVFEIGHAIKEIIASFFSERAINYRILSDSYQLPVFAISAHVFINGPSGVIFSKGNGCDWQAEIDKETGVIVGSNGTQHDTYTKVLDHIYFKGKSNLLSDSQLSELNDIILKAEKFMGGQVDIEFAIRNGQIIILQMRGFFDNTENENESPITNGRPKLQVKLSRIEDLSSLSFPPDSRIDLHIPETINIDLFQGELLRWLVKNRNVIRQISLSQVIPLTGHFSNICSSLGIKIVLPERTE